MPLQPPANEAPLQGGDAQMSQGWLEHHEQVARLAEAAAPAKAPVLEGSSTVDGPDGTERMYRVSTSGIVAWDWGALIGSDFALRRYTDVGEVASTELTVSRQTGAFVVRALGTSAEFRHAGTLGFFGAAPGVRPTVTGSWKGAAAGKNLAQSLAALGLIVDGTTLA